MSLIPFFFLFRVLLCTAYECNVYLRTQSRGGDEILADLRSRQLSQKTRVSDFLFLLLPPLGRVLG